MAKKTYEDGKDNRIIIDDSDMTDEGLVSIAREEKRDGRWRAAEDLVMLYPTWRRILTDQRNH